MAADLILTAGPFFGHVEGELEALSKQMHKRGCHWQRAHQHKAWIILEGWRHRPAEQGDLPEARFLDALVNKDITGDSLVTQAPVIEGP